MDVDRILLGMSDLDAPADLPRDLDAESNPSHVPAVWRECHTMAEWQRLHQREVSQRGRLGSRPRNSRRYFCMPW